MKRLSVKGLGLGRFFALSVCHLVVCISQSVGVELGQFSADYNDYFTSCLDYAIKMRIQDNPTMDERSLDIVEKMVVNSFDEDGCLDIFITNLRKNCTKEAEQCTGKTHEDVKKIIMVYIKDFMQKLEADHACDEWLSKAVAVSADWQQLGIAVTKRCASNLVHHMCVRKKGEFILASDLVKKVFRNTANTHGSMRDYIMELISNYLYEIKSLHGDIVPVFKGFMDKFVEGVVRKELADVACEKWVIKAEQLGLQNLKANYKDWYVHLNHAIYAWLKEKKTKSRKSSGLARKIMRGAFRENIYMLDFINDIIRRFKLGLFRMDTDEYDGVNKIVSVFLEELIKQAGADLSSMNNGLESSFAHHQEMLPLDVRQPHPVETSDCA